MNLPLVTAFLAWAKRLRFRQLFFLTAGLFIADLFIPDMLPFADELLLGLATLLFANWKDKRHTPKPVETVQTDANADPNEKEKDTV